MTLRVVNPTTGELVREYPEMDVDAVRQRIEEAALTFESWRRGSMTDRSRILHETARVLENRKTDFARLMAVEMGKPVSDGRAEIDKCAWVCRHYADEAERMLAPEAIRSDASESCVTFAPLGVILAVMPWNYPFWQVFRFAAPALMAGNTVLLKHASNVPGCAQAIAEVFARAGLPPHVFQSLLIAGDRVAPVIDHPAVRAVSVTGSRRAGRAVATRAGESLKKSVLELGGSDPCLILEDADMASTVDACITSRLLNSGQSCIAAKRFIVVEAVRKKFEERMLEELKSVRMGNPLEEESRIGPQARADLREALHRQVLSSIAKGARCRVGGHVPVRKGFFYPPTVLTDVQPGMPVFDEETFGPVFAVIPVADEREAVSLANQTCFGLGAAVFTRDVSRGRRIAAEELEAGNCFVNAFVKSDPRLPFGGIKDSGYGRELSHFGIREFVNIKTIYVA